MLLGGHGDRSPFRAQRGAFAAAVTASAIYTLLNVPSLLATSGLTSGDLLLIVARIAAFGLVGIVGGEAVRPSALRLRPLREVDRLSTTWSQVFNQRHAAESTPNCRRGTGALRSALLCGPRLDLPTQ